MPRSPVLTHPLSKISRNRGSWCFLLQVIGGPRGFRQEYGVLFMRVGPSTCAFASRGQPSAEVMSAQVQESADFLGRGHSGRWVLGETDASRLFITGSSACIATLSAIRSTEGGLSWPFAMDWVGQEGEQISRAAVWPTSSPCSLVFSYVLWARPRLPQSCRVPWFSQSVLSI